MKWMIVSLVSLMMAQAQASYVEENCATADGTARWETGHNDNRIYFRKQNYETGEWTSHEFDSYDVNILLAKKKTIKKKSSGGECWAGEDHWYSATATVTPKAEIQPQFKSVFPSGKFTDFVICHDQYSGDTCK